MTVNLFVQSTATIPAKAYGLLPRKRTIASGGDSDFLIWEERDYVLRILSYYAADYTPYECIRLRAWPAMTLSRGDLGWVPPIALITF